MKSLPPGISEENITGDIAVKIIAMPSKIGIDTNSNEPIIKDIGRYGPYIKCGSKNSKITAPDNILDITLDKAIELLEKGSSGPSILKDLGKHDGNKIVIKNGRYGMYVTNGKVNVTLPKNDDYNNLDLNTAIDMIKNKKTTKRKFKRK